MFSLKSILGYFADASWLCTLVVDFLLVQIQCFCAQQGCLSSPCPVFWTFSSPIVSQAAVSVCYTNTFCLEGFEDAREAAALSGSFVKQNAFYFL